MLLKFAKLSKRVIVKQQSAVKRRNQSTDSFNFIMPARRRSLSGSSVQSEDSGNESDAYEPSDDEDDRRSRSQSPSKRGGKGRRSRSRSPSKRGGKGRKKTSKEKKKKLRKYHRVKRNNTFEELDMYEKVPKGDLGARAFFKHYQAAMPAAKAKNALRKSMPSAFKSKRTVKDKNGNTSRVTVYSKPRIGSGAPIYISAVMHYITEQVFDAIGDIRKALKIQSTRRISPWEIALALKTDSDLAKLVEGTTFAESLQRAEATNPRMFYIKGKPPTESQNGYHKYERALRVFTMQQNAHARLMEMGWKSTKNKKDRKLGVRASVYTAGHLLDEALSNPISLKAYRKQQRKKKLKEKGAEAKSSEKGSKRKPSTEKENASPKKKKKVSSKKKKEVSLRRKGTRRSLRGKSYGAGPDAMMEENFAHGGEW